MYWLLLLCNLVCVANCVLSVLDKENDDDDDEGKLTILGIKSRLSKNAWSLCGVPFSLETFGQKWHSGHQSLVLYVTGIQSTVLQNQKNESMFEIWQKELTCNGMVHCLHHYAPYARHNCNSALETSSTEWLQTDYKVERWQNWAATISSRRKLSSMGSSRPVMQLSKTTISAADHIRVLRVVISSDLRGGICPMSAPSSSISDQLCHVRHSLDSDSVSTLIRYFTSRLNYCNVVFVGKTKAITNRLQTVLNAAARVVSNIHKFDVGLTNMTHHKLKQLSLMCCREWRIQTQCNGLSLLACHCSLVSYWIVYCTLIANVASQRHLRSVCKTGLMVKLHKLSSMGSLVFSVSVPSVWNSLADYVRGVALEQLQQGIS